MNATAQQTHRTVTASLDARLATVETLLEALIAQDQQLLAAGQELAGRVEQNRQRCQDYWDAQNLTNGRLIDADAELRDRRFWQRLRWLVMGY